MPQRGSFKPPAEPVGKPYGCDFSNGNWYIEDVGSNNGISIHKGQANRLYKISANSPCRVESGDILFIGMNRLALR